MYQRRGKNIFAGLLGCVMGLAILLTPVSLRAAEQEEPPMPEGSAVLENTVTDDSVQNDSVANVIKEFTNVVVDTAKDSIKQFRSKKGVQGANLIAKEYKDLGVQHTLFNARIDSLISSPSEDYDVEYEYEGETYYFKYISGLWPEQVHPYNAAGWDVSVVLLLGNTKPYLVHPSVRNAGGHAYYAWNLEDAATIETYQALFHFLGETYGRNSDPEWACFIKNWIIGNEVNMPNAYNYTGTTDLATNVDLYSKQYVLATDILKSHNSEIKTYVSLDHSWTHNDEGRGIAGKSFLDAFVKRINVYHEGIDWNIAYHPYPAIMTNSNIWGANGYTTKTLGTEFISGYNLEVLTNYVKNTWGSNVRIILSEVGFTAANGQQEAQAASLAYTYYKAQFDDMVDSVIFRALRDDPNETPSGFYFGFLNADGTKRPVYDVFKYMDTPSYQSATTASLQRMGISDWSQVIAGFNPAAFCPVVATSIAMSEAQLSIPVGYSRTLTYSIAPANAWDTITWTSSNPAVATVDANGVVTAVSEGSTVITVSGENVSASCTVTVKNVHEAWAQINSFVERLYTCALERPAEEGGRIYWVDQLMNGYQDGATVATGFILSEEIAAKNLNDTEYLGILYKTLLGREADEGGVAYWSHMMANGVTRKCIFANFVVSEEFNGICLDAGIKRGSYFSGEEVDRNYNVTMYVFRCYDRVMGRVPATSELEYWAKMINTKSITPVGVAEFFVLSEELENKNLSDEEFVKVLYRLCFDREADEGGLSYWVEQLEKKTMTRKVVLQNFAWSKEFENVLISFNLQ